MGNLTKDFSRHEFACYCGCGFDTADFALVEALQELRDYYGKPVRITPKGGCRCRRANDAAGGSEFSQHMLGRGVDFTVDDTHPAQVQAYLRMKYPGKYGIGSYSTFTHFDTRTTGPARWVI